MQRLIALFILLLCPLSNTLTAESSAGSPQYAKNFSIVARDTHKQLTVRIRLGDDERVDRYALVPRGKPLPELPAEVQIIRTPVRRVVVMETVYIGYLDAIGQLDRIVGAATVDFISHPGVRDAVDAGRIQTVQIGQSLDIERLMLLQPDLILTSLSGDPAFDVPPQLIRSGLPVVLTAGYMEPHPLARAEWIRFIAAFFEASEPADAFFVKTADRYEALQERTSQLERRPTVFSGAPYSGNWHVASGDSYTSRAIADAGGAYVWAEHKSQKAIPLDTERVFLKAAEADIWLHPSHYRTLDELFAADPRFTKFTAARTGQVYNNTRQVGNNGGNNIWERGVVRPDEVLADLINIFHPQVIPDHEPVFYERLN